MVTDYPDNLINEGIRRGRDELEAELRAMMRMGDQGDSTAEDQPAKLMADILTWYDLGACPAPPEGEERLRRRQEAHARHLPAQMPNLCTYCEAEQVSLRARGEAR